jgi:hypothetical protein
MGELEKQCWLTTLMIMSIVVLDAVYGRFGTVVFVSLHKKPWQLATRCFWIASF